jgi:hypothetical protein
VAKRHKQLSEQSDSLRKTRKPKAPKPEPKCKRIGTKRSDLRCKDPAGDIWASPFEFNVYDAIKDKGDFTIRRATERDSLAYSTAIRGGRCTECGCSTVVQDRSYTPDLYLVWKGVDRLTSGFYVEVKGYLPGPKRNLFRQVKAQHPHVDLRIVAQSDHWVTKGKSRLSDWAKRYKIKFHLWNGSLPEDW